MKVTVFYPRPGALSDEQMSGLLWGDLQPTPALVAIGYAEAATFEFEPEQPQLIGDRLFQRMNHWAPEDEVLRNTVVAKAVRGAITHTSMSIGDVIALDGIMLAVGRVGFYPIEEIRSSGT